MDPGTLDLIQRAGPLGMTVLALVAFWRGWVVMRWTFDAMERDLRAQLAKAEKDGDEWKSLSLRLLNAAESAATAAVTAVRGKQDGGAP